MKLNNLFPKTRVPVQGVLTITGRVQMIALMDMPKLQIKKGQAIGKPISKKLWYAMPNPKYVMR
jgi:hypothetical protein